MPRLDEMEKFPLPPKRKYFRLLANIDIMIRPLRTLAFKYQIQNYNLGFVAVFHYGQVLRTWLQNKSIYTREIATVLVSPMYPTIQAYCLSTGQIPGDSNAWISHIGCQRARTGFYRINQQNGCVTPRVTPGTVSGWKICIYPDVDIADSPLQKITKVRLMTN